MQRLIKQAPALPGLRVPGTVTVSWIFGRTSLSPRAMYCLPRVSISRGAPATCAVLVLLSMPAKLLESLRVVAVELKRTLATPSPFRPCARRRRHLQLRHRAVISRGLLFHGRRDLSTLERGLLPRRARHGFLGS